MSPLSKFVSLHPYFKVHPGKLSVNGDEIFCREGYTDAEGLLAHLDNVGALLAEMLTMADLNRVEVHGPTMELEKLKKPLAHLNPAFFAVECTLEKA